MANAYRFGRYPHGFVISLFHVCNNLRIFNLVKFGKILYRAAGGEKSGTGLNGANAISNFGK